MLKKYITMPIMLSPERDDELAKLTDQVEPIILLSLDINRKSGLIVKELLSEPTLAFGELLYFPVKKRPLQF